MFNYKPVLAAAVIALAAPLAMTSPSLAQGARGHGSHGGHSHMGGGGHMGGGHGGGGRHMAGGGWHGGGNHGGWHGGHRHHGGGGFFPGFVAGTAIGVGSAFADPYYYDDGAYGYYDDSPDVEVVPSGGGDVAYCQQRFKSYDVSSGTYLGYDGMRHPCP
jgi:hypothetical protein